MTERDSTRPIGAFDLLACMAGLVCLCAALGIILLLLPSSGPGVPFDPRRIARLVLCFQVCVLVGAVGVPGLVLVVRRQFAIAPVARRLVFAATIVLGLELIVLWATRAVGG